LTLPVVAAVEAIGGLTLPVTAVAGATGGLTLAVFVPVVVAEVVAAEGLVATETTAA
jgi:hypothetical protein